MRAEYLPGGIFALLHPGQPAQEGPTAVVLVPPFGSEEVASYRERRWLADELAAAGYPTLRIDLPGAGDSAGTPADPGRLAAWTAAVGAAVERMRQEGPRVAVLACGLGAIPATLALAGGVRVDDLVLWAAPETGRAAVRRLRSLSRLQPNRVEPGGADGPGLPEGWLEVGGYALDPGTLRELAAVDLAELGTGAGRVLLLHRDGMPAADVLAAAWRSAGAQVETAPGDGYDAMLEHPQRTNPPREVAERLVAWLRAGAPAAPAAAAARGAVATRLPVTGGAEVAFACEGSEGRLFGILAEPEVQQDGPCLVLFNAGAQRRTGPNRMWVEAARRWVASGVPVLRVDVAAIGDADGDEGALREDAAFYRATVLEDARAVLDELENRGIARRFVLGGLCGGAYIAFHLGATDPRVTSVCLVNPQALVWREDLHEQREARKLRRAMSLQGWRDLMGGRISLQAVMPSLLAALRLRLAWRSNAGPAAGEVVEVASIQDGLDRLRDSGTRVVLGFSGEEPLVRDLEADGTRARLAAWANLTWDELPGSDHELRPLQAQRAAHSLVDQAVRAGAAQG